jgi:hypothetical protein
MNDYHDALTLLLNHFRYIYCGFDEHNREVAKYIENLGNPRSVQHRIIKGEIETELTYGTYILRVTSPYKNE